MTAALAIHDPNCSTWDTPAESGADHLVAIGYHDERIAAYLSTLRPVYDAMKRCLGQMAGLLLLLQTRCLDPHRAGVTHDAMREILAELSDRLRALKAPEGAQRHFRGLEALVRQLEAGAEQLNRQKDLIDPASADLDALVRRLFTIQQGLLAAAEPRAGLSHCRLHGRLLYLPSKINKTRKLTHDWGGKHVALFDLCPRIRLCSRI